jgi:hypothetical protein
VDHDTPSAVLTGGQVIAEEVGFKLEHAISRMY